MRIETILDAYFGAIVWVTVELRLANNNERLYRRARQRDAFCARILRMDAEKDAKIALFNVCRDSYDTLLKQQIELDQQLAEKDARIAELERSHQALVEHHRDDHHHNWTGIGEPEE